MRCQSCGGEMIRYGRRKRRVLSKYREAEYVTIQRWRCKECGRMHDELPSDILPHKHYEREMVEGVQEGLVDSSILGYEDYPCEMTMRRWRKTYRG